MKRITYLLFMVFTLSIAVGTASCNPDDSPLEQPGSGATPNPNPAPNPNPKPPVTGNKANLIVGSTIFTITFQNNETANAFKQLLPMTINMSELNNNEKYYGLPGALPTNHSKPGTIQNGDLMLYGSDTLVLFYKSFSTSYSYTRIGNVDNPSGLQNALGTSSVTVTFEMTE